MSTNLKTLISKLDDTSRRAAERAASLCMAQGHYEVDIEHLFLALLEQPRSDFSLLCKHFDVAESALQNDLRTEIGRFKNGNTRTPVFSPHLPALFEHAWLIASLDAHHHRIRSGHLLMALLTAPDLSQLAFRGSKLFVKFKLDDLKHRLAELTKGSQESTESMRSADAPAGDAADVDAAARQEAQPTGTGATPALDQFTTNLTQRARDGRLDPVIGREHEIRQVIDILMRRRQNNPILTGEAGVGKTAVVEGLALRIVAADVPPPLVNVELHTLDMGLLQAGASVKGEFENRLRGVIDEVKRSAKPLILFIDEAHTMIGAGGPAGQSDAANLLKPALARGELRTVAATTWSEYKKYFEKDAALARCFQVVKVEEPSEPIAAAMLRGMAPLMEKHFGVRVLDAAITEAVRLSHRYIIGRQLPDKAIGVLDTACAKVALSQSSTPAAIDDTHKKLERMDAEIKALTRDALSAARPSAAKVGAKKTAAHDPDAERLAALTAERMQLDARLAVDRERWAGEQALVADIQKLRAQLLGETPGAATAAEAASESASASVFTSASTATLAPKKKSKSASPSEIEVSLHTKIDALRALQGESPMVAMQVDGHEIGRAHV